MRQPGVFYDPSVHDWGSKVVQGGLAGMAMARNAQEYEAGNMKMDKAKKEEQAEAKVGEIYKELQEKLKAAPAIDEAFENKAAGMAPASTALAEQAADPESKVMESGGLAGAAAEQENEKLKGKRIEAIKFSTDLMAEATNKRHQVYMEAGLSDKADALTQRHIAEAAALGKNVGKGAALSFLQKGPLAKMFIGNTEDDIEILKDRIKVDKVGKNNDGFVEYDYKTRELRVLKEPTVDEKKPEKATAYDDYRKGKLAAGWSEDKVAEGWAALQHPRAAGGGASGKEEKWTIPKIRAEWDKAESLIGKRIKEIQSELSVIGEERGPDQKAADPLNTELDSLRKVQRNIPAYRDNDADAVKNGHGPINYGKVARYIANPEVGSGKAAGKVGDESKGLIRGKYSKVVEDPKTKKRYGVKPDGTKEPIQ